MLIIQLMSLFSVPQNSLTLDWFGKKAVVNHHRRLWKETRHGDLASPLISKPTIPPAKTFGEK